MDLDEATARAAEALTAHAEALIRTIQALPEGLVVLQCPVGLNPWVANALMDHLRTVFAGTDRKVILLQDGLALEWVAVPDEEAPGVLRRPLVATLEDAPWDEAAADPVYTIAYLQRVAAVVPPGHTLVVTPTYDMHPDDVEQLRAAVAQHAAEWACGVRHARRELATWPTAKVQAALEALEGELARR